MGRAMLIIVAGVLIAVGITQTNQQQTVLDMTRHTTTYAESTQAYNMTHTGLQLTVNEFMQDPGMCSEGSQDNYEVDDGVIVVEHLQCGDPDDEDNSIYRLRSTATFADREHSATVTYHAHWLHFVPEFDSAIKITTDDFNFDLAGSGGDVEISGSDPTGDGSCGDKPGITYPSEGHESKFEDYENHLFGNPPYGYDSETTFDPAAELIERLEGQPGTQTISGNVNENLGSEEKPGVFMVEGNARLAGGASEGWGILIIKASGEMEMEDPELDLGGNFTFNGLVIYENAFSLSAKGTPSINGTVMVGKTNESVGTMDIDFAGTVDIQYDCTMQKYAEKASANVSQAGMKFTVLSVYE